MTGIHHTMHLHEVLNIIVAEDGVEAFTEEEHLSGLEYIKRMYGADIKKIREIINLFKQNGHI